MNTTELWDAIDRIEVMLKGMTALLNELVAFSRSNAVTKAAYSVSEAAAVLGKRPYTVREWCRLQRINATKRPWGRGNDHEWEISNEEIERIQNHGLLPIPKRY
jgi:hypothetical protein